MIRFVFVGIVFLAMNAYAQVSVEGVVIHDGEALDEVLIQVMQDNKVQRTVAANKRGRFEVEFLVDEEYVVVFQRPYMIPVKIAVNTEVPEDLLEDGTSVEVPLNMELFKRFKGMDVSPYGKPIGKIKQVGSGKNLFQFVPDPLVLPAVKSVNEESRRRASAGEEPILSEFIRTDDLPSQAALKEKINEPKDPKTVSEAVPPKVEEVEVDEADVNARRFEQVEAGELARNELKRAQANRADAGLAKEDVNQIDYISEAKRLKQQQAEQEAMNRSEAVNAHVARQEQMEDWLMMAAVSKTPNEVPPTMLLRREFESGVIQSSERLWISRNGTEHAYEKVDYNWLLFEVSYYYHNEEEISESEYREVRALFE